MSRRSTLASMGVSAAAALVSISLVALAQESETPAGGDVDVGLTQLDVQADLPPVTTTTSAPTLPSTSTSPVDPQLVEAQEAIARERAHQAALERSRATLPEAEQALTRALHRDVRALYRLRHGGLLPIAGGLPALVNHASRVAHLERMAKQSARRLRDVRARESALAKEAAELDAKLSTLEREARALEEKRASLAAEAAAAAALAAQRAQIAARSEAQSEERVSYGLTLVGTEEKQRESLSAQRGLLALPVAAASSIAPTEPVTDGRRRGLSFTTTPGASVRAAAAGRVASIEHGSDGLVVVLDHGARYQTVYMNLASSDLEPGDSVSKSARLGSAGSAPVKFEVRRGSRNQDARSYLGL